MAKPVAATSPERRIQGVDRRLIRRVEYGCDPAKLHHERSIGEIHMLAVDPDYQGGGIGTALTEFALDWIKDAGMAVAMVETGDDPGHAAARRTYEKVGYTRVPIARYFKKL